MLRGGAVDVIEKMGSQNAKVGNMLFARVIQIDSVAMLIGCGSILIPPRLKPEMIRFRNWLLEVEDPISTETLQAYDFEIREFYFALYDGLTQPPELQNTDGEPFIFHTLYYEIDSPDQAFESLTPLSVVQSKKELRSEAELDEAGRIMRVTIPWSRKGHKKNDAFNSTILGRLEIDKRRLKVDVNSARRAELIRQEIETRLGNHARYQTMKIQSPEAMLDAETDQKGEGIALGSEHDELMQIPEVREQMQQMLAAHWKGWVDEEIPALGGKTPRQAVKTSDGRESVEALLLDAERQMAKDKHMRDFAPKVIADARRRLGIDKSAPAASRGTDKREKTERVDEIQRLIKSFGQTHLTIECTDLALKLCGKIGRMRKLSIQRGRVEIWAAAIVHVIARLNFLLDPENELSLTADDICKFFGTKKTTVSSKAGLIQKTGNIYLGDAEFSIPEIARMFSIHETKDGLLIPGFMLDKYEDDSRPADKSPLAHNGHKTNNKNRRNSKAQGKGQHRKTNKKSNDRQLKLFNDD